MKKLILLGLLSLSLIGCSTKVGYYFLDWVIEWKLEEYVTLDDKQEKQFELTLDAFLVWHRTQELPRYKDQLVRLAAEINHQRFSIESWNEHVGLVKAHWIRVFDFVEPSLIPIISSFSDEQVKQVVAQLRVGEKELNEKYLGKSQSQLIEMADERIEQRVKKLIGKLSTAQKSAINDYNVARADTLDMWLEHRHEWIRLFSQALKNRKNQVALSHSLRLLMTQPERLKSKAYQAILNDNTAMFGMLLLNINNLASKGQRQRFAKS